MSVTERFDDRLEPVGIAVGVLLVLIGVGTVAGTPWTVKGDAAASALQILGVLLTVGIGVLLVWLSRTD
jgi:protein-S-isoprenylcysteine O-methyltransferase Ste14